MDLLFLGGHFDRKQEEIIFNKSPGTVQYAANKFQWNLIQGFLNIPEINLKLLSAPFVGSYPKYYSDIWIEPTYHFLNGKKIGYAVGFNNLPLLRILSRTKSLTKAIKSFAHSNAEKKTIIVYSVHTPFLKAAIQAKKIDSNIQICLVVPDLPEYMNLREDKSIVYSLLKKYDVKLFNKYLKKVDSFVLLTKYMKEKLNVGNRPFEIVEGIVSTNISNDNRQMSKEKRIVYSGTLNKKFGVLDLVNAFNKIDEENTYLYICGSGDSEDMILEQSKMNKKIVFLGQITNDESTRLQETASVLVNPRPNNEEYTKYSFPSKNMEYLVSGIPMVGRKLDGIPNEYNNYMFFTEDDSVDSLSKTLQEVLSMHVQDRVDYGKNARNFVLNEKNQNKIASKIYNMILNK